MPIKTKDGEELSVTIIIPTRNEIEGMKWFMPQLKKEWYDELIIVDGGSTDGTLEWCKKNGYNAFSQATLGLALALNEAFERSSKDIILAMSPDGNSIPELIPDLLDSMREGNDMTIVSRYCGSAKSYDDDFFTGIGNYLFTRLINLLFGGKYTDSLVIYRAYRRDAILRMKLNDSVQDTWLKRKFPDICSWEIGSSIRAAKLKLKVSDIPGDEPKRRYGVRKLSILFHGTTALLQILVELLKGKKV